jgi:hypothetical protein
VCTVCFEQEEYPDQGEVLQCDSGHSLCRECSDRLAARLCPECPECPACAQCPECPADDDERPAA